MHTPKQHGRPMCLYNAPVHWGISFTGVAATGMSEYTRLAKVQLLPCQRGAILMAWGRTPPDSVQCPAVVMAMLCTGRCCVRLVGKAAASDRCATFMCAGVPLQGMSVWLEAWGTALETHVSLAGGLGHCPRNAGQSGWRHTKSRTRLSRMLLSNSSGMPKELWGSRNSNYICRCALLLPTLVHRGS